MGITWLHFLVEEICLILINLRCVLIMHGKNTPHKCNFFLYSYQNETKVPMKSIFFVLHVSFEINLNMHMSSTLIEYVHRQKHHSYVGQIHWPNLHPIIPTANGRWQC